MRKIGLYTSPHLRFVRERIQINNEPLSEEKFAHYFFEIWDRLDESAKEAGKPADLTAKPVYFRYLTLMALHTYMSEGIDTAIIECGIGGEYDSTNILVSPTVTGITSLGIDHTAVLGSTIEEIAWHKAGIMKQTAPCFTVEQPKSAFEVLQQRADAVPTSLNIAPRKTHDSGIKLGLAAPFQFINADLATAIAAAHLKSLGFADRIGNSAPALPREFVQGLEITRWPGRCEVRHEQDVTWHIDGAHTIESIELAASWFASRLNSDGSGVSTRKTRILLLNQQTRDANALARALHQSLAAVLKEEHPFTHVVFCSNVTFKDRGYMPDLQSNNSHAAAVQTLQVQNDLAKTWKNIEPEAFVEVKGTIEEAVRLCRDVAGREKEAVPVLVTGSVHLVGGFLEVLEGS